MSDADDLSSSLPPPREDEPPALRSDILDELADHLSLANRREVLRLPGAGDAEIRQAVLDRFGNPRKVARELYLDAMKERIMKDRVLIGLMVVMLIAIVGVSALAFASFRQNQEMMQTLLAKIDDRSSGAVSERGTLGITVIDERSQAIRGIEVQLKGEPVRMGQEHTIKRMTDEQGQVVFTKLLPGSYELKIESNVSDDCEVRFARSILLPPDEDVEQEIVMPSMPKLAPVTLVFQGHDLQGESGRIAVALAYHLPERFGSDWRGVVGGGLLHLEPADPKSMPPRYVNEMPEGSYAVSAVGEPGFDRRSAAGERIVLVRARYRPPFKFEVDGPTTVELQPPKKEDAASSR